MSSAEKVSSVQIVLHGIGVSPGVVFGPAFLLSSRALQVIEYNIAENEIDLHISRFEDAIIETRKQIKKLQNNLEKLSDIHDASILDAHLMVLDDMTFIEDVVNTVRRDRKNIEFVVNLVSEKYAQVLAAVNDDYLRERVADVKDVARRLMRILSGDFDNALHDLKHKHIIVSADLAPSETASLRKDMVLGFVTNMGSPTSHTAVMARALEIPAIVALKNVTENVKNGDQILIDGNKGVLIINPDEDQLEKYGKLSEFRKSIERGLANLKLQPARTIDGRKITLCANIEGTSELDSIKEHGADGVGLFRTEYLYLAQNKRVSEEDQIESYADAANAVFPNHVIIRTFDLGGDKYIPDAHIAKEANPFLGCRSIRMSLLYPEEFKKQLRAILRASHRKNVKIMYPMISNAQEVVKANELLEEAKGELRRSGVSFDEEIDVGAMIEIPAAALTAEIIAEHVDFFSLGTNDLIQYTVAVDRVNERVAYLYEPTHLAVLRLIQRTIDVGHKNNIWVGICGEMAADPVLTPLLIGMGVDEMSVAPSMVPLIKDAIRSVSYEQCKELAEKAMECKTAVEVLSICRKMLKDVAPELLELT